MTDQTTTLAERADDYVLGLLAPDEAAAIESAMEMDAALRAAIGASRDRFIELDLAGPEAQASAALWQRIEASLDQPWPAVTPPAAAQANDNHLGRWKAVALAGLAACAVLVIALGYTLLGQQNPQVIAILVDDKGTPLVLVEDFGNTRSRITPLADYIVPAGRQMQVWTLPSKEIGPTSLGLLDDWHTSLLDSRALPAPHEEQLYEITLEQPGGSPTGLPTGPILVKGFAKIPR